MGLHLNLDQDYNGRGPGAAAGQAHRQVVRFLSSSKFARLVYHPFLRRQFREVVQSQSPRSELPRNRKTKRASFEASLAMKQTMKEIQVRGKERRVPVALIEGRKFVSTGRWLKTAQIKLRITRRTNALKTRPGSLAS